MQLFIHSGASFHYKLLINGDKLANITYAIIMNHFKTSHVI